MEEKVWTILDIIKWTTDYFEKKGIESPRLNIELMLCQILGISRLDIYTQFEKPLTDVERKILRDMINKRVKRMPLQYILGNTNFYGNNFLVNNSVMIPRPETELLVDKVLKDIENKYFHLNILDIGTGSGCIALSLAKELPNSIVFGIDNSYFALLTAKNNASNLAIKNILFYQCDILKEIPFSEKFDIIVSNPPYIPLNEYQNLEPEVKFYEPKESLTDNADGLTFYKRFVKILPEMLKDNGQFYFEFGFLQSEILTNLFNENGFDIKILKDFNNIDRILYGFNRKV